MQGCLGGCGQRLAIEENAEAALFLADDGFLE
jgi:hypothetical protein